MHYPATGPRKRISDIRSVRQHVRDDVKKRLSTTRRKVCDYLKLHSHYATNQNGSTARNDWRLWQEHTFAPKLLWFHFDLRPLQQQSFSHCLLKWSVHHTSGTKMGAHHTSSIITWAWKNLHGKSEKTVNYCSLPFATSPNGPQTKKSSKTDNKLCTPHVRPSEN